MNYHVTQLVPTSPRICIKEINLSAGGNETSDNYKSRKQCIRGNKGLDNQVYLVVVGKLA